MKYHIIILRLKNAVRAVFGFPFYVYRGYQCNNEILGILQELVREKTAVRQEINSVEQEINSVEQEINSVQSNVSEVIQKVSSLEGNINAVDQKASFIKQNVISVDHKFNELDRVFYGKHLKDPCFKKMMNLKKDILFLQETYSQEGESLFILELIRKFLPHYKGFYVDVGSYHPKRFSNTYALYKMGWSGINIDADPTSIALFNEERPGDINLNIGVGDVETTKHFYMFDEPAFNTFDKDKALSVNNASGKFSLIQSIDVSIKTLNSILEKYLTENEKIDFLDIDAEGMDEEIVFSFDWNKYMPTFVMIEVNSFETIKESIEDKKVKFLEGLGYLLFVKTARTGIFVSNLFYEKYMQGKQVGVV